jgi:hypothetical protein
MSDNLFEGTSSNDLIKRRRPGLGRNCGVLEVSSGGKRKLASPRSPDSAKRWIFADWYLRGIKTRTWTERFDGAPPQLPNKKPMLLVGSHRIDVARNCGSQATTYPVNGAKHVATHLLPRSERVHYVDPIGALPHEWSHAKAESEANES